MGQLVNVVEKPSRTNIGVVRFETNRVLSGTGHDRFRAGDVVDGERPVDELARRLFARGGVAAVHVNGGVVTVDLEKGWTADGLADIIRGLYTYYVPDPVEIVEELAAATGAAAPSADAAEAATEAAAEVLDAGADGPLAAHAVATEVRAEVEAAEAKAAEAKAAEESKAAEAKAAEESKAADESEGTE